MLKNGWFRCVHNDADPECTSVSPPHASSAQGAIFKADILDNGAIRFNLAGELRRPCRGGIV
jgi:hypothetical protein